MTTRGKTVDSKRDREGQLVMSLLATFLKEGKTTHGVLLCPDYVRRIPLRDVQILSDSPSSVFKEHIRPSVDGLHRDGMGRI